jgi:hypothetical protein
MTIANERLAQLFELHANAGKVTGAYLESNAEFVSILRELLYLRAIPRGGVKVTDEGIAKAMTAFAMQVREQDPNWEYENGEEGEPLLSSPDGDYFALEYPLRAAIAALSVIEQDQATINAEYEINFMDSRESK